MKNVNEVGDDVIKKPLIMGDDQKGVLFGFQFINAVGQPSCLIRDNSLARFSDNQRGARVKEDVILSRSLIKEIEFSDCVIMAAFEIIYRLTNRSLFLQRLRPALCPRSGRSARHEECERSRE